MSTDEILDRLFLDCLVEIQKSYVNISKSLRLRVEKWCEKLVGAGGSNRMWKKTRNDYAKLLLGMICSNRFSEPFHTTPPDGPLPTFPTYLKTRLKDSLGPHESSFWRQLYTSMSEPLEPPTPPQMSKSSNPHNREPSESFARFSGVISNQKEIQSLALLAREQEQRIMLLEQQLRDERLAHELEIQRLLYAHRTELVRVTGRVPSSSSHNGELSSSLNPSLAGSLNKSHVSSPSDSFKFAEPEGNDDHRALLGTIKASAYDPSPTSPKKKIELFADAAREGRSGNTDAVYQPRTAEEEDDDFLRYIEKFQRDIKQSVVTASGAI